MPVGRYERPIRNLEAICFEHGERTPPEEFGSAHFLAFGDLIETLDQVIVELYEDLLAGHDHMLEHMVYEDR